MDINFDTGKAFLVVVLTILGVVVINVSIYYMVRGRGTIQQIEMLRKATKQVRNPWELEDQALDELSTLVKSLKKESVQPVSNPEEYVEGSNKNG